MNVINEKYQRGITYSCLIRYKHKIYISLIFHIKLFGKYQFLRYTIIKSSKIGNSINTQILTFGKATDKLKDNNLSIENEDDTHDYLIEVKTGFNVSMSGINTLEINEPNAKII